MKPGRVNDVRVFEAKTETPRESIKIVGGGKYLRYNLWMLFDQDEVVK